MGGFASLDPFEGVNTRVMSVNGYSWVEGNGINATDPSGRGVDTEIALTLNTGGCASRGNQPSRSQSGGSQTNRSTTGKNTSNGYQYTLASNEKTSSASGHPCSECDKYLKPDYESDFTTNPFRIPNSLLWSTCMSGCERDLNTNIDFSDLFPAAIRRSGLRFAGNLLLLGALAGLITDVDVLVTLIELDALTGVSAKEISDDQDFRSHSIPIPTEQVPQSLPQEIGKGL